MKLNLDELLKVKSDKRNDEVFRMYEHDESITGLCGGDVNGVLIEEDCETILRESNIDLLISNEKVAMLIQCGNIYAVDNQLGTEGCNTPQYHLNFDTLREIVSLDKTFMGALVVGGILEEMYLGTSSDAIENQMYDDYSRNTFDPTSDDAKIFNALGKQTAVCYEEDEEEGDDINNG